MIGIVQGLIVTMKHVLRVGNRPTVTVQYPYQKMKVSPRFRGLHAVDENACIGCGICEVNCPNATISIVKYNKKWYPQVNIGMCLFCGLCVDVCPMKLVPNQIANFVEYNKIEDAHHLGILNCMKCGCCSYICPAKRNLLQYIDLGKALWHEKQEKVNQ